MPRSRSKKMRRRRSRHIRYKGRRTHVSRKIKRRRRESRRQMRGGGNQWTCARKSSKDNKLYETVSPGEKIQTLLSGTQDSRFTSSRAVGQRGKYSEDTLSLGTSRFTSPRPVGERGKYSEALLPPSTHKLPSTGPPPSGKLQGKSDLQKSQSNKKAMEQLGRSRNTTRKLIEDNLAKRRKVIAGEYSAQNPGFNPDNPAN